MCGLQGVLPTTLEGPTVHGPVRGVVGSLTRAAGQTTQMRGRVSKVSPRLGLVTRE